MRKKPAKPVAAFGGRLRTLRRAAGLTRAGLAEKLRVHVSSVSGWELGKRQPREALQADLARILGCSTSQLFDGDSRSHPSAAMLIDSTHDLPDVLAECTRRAQAMIRVMRFGSPYATAAHIHVAPRTALGNRVAEGSVELQRLEIVYALPRLKELLSNVLRYAPQHYRLKIACPGLKQIAPFFGGCIFDNREMILGGYWSNNARSSQPCIRLIGEPHITYYNAYWSEVWNREPLVNPRGRNDLSAVQEIAFTLGLPKRGWKRFVEEAEAYTIGDGAPPLS